MEFELPKVEFIELTLKDITTTSGPGVEVCRMYNDEAMTLEHFCGMITGQGSTASLGWTEVCASVVGDTTNMGGKG